jgi:HK97 family phage portal protein
VIVRTFEGLQALTPPTPTWSSSSHAVQTYDRHEAYAEIYRTQPNVRICVDFLARNYALIPQQVFRRVSDTDRVRLADHDLERWLGHPNPATSGYRLKESLMGDLGVYFNAYVFKVRYVAADGRDAIGLVRIPPHQMRAEPQGKLLPEYFVWTVGGREKRLELADVVYFNGYNPCNAFEGLSPMETLRSIIAEEAAAVEYRQSYWRNSSKHEGVWEMAKDAPGWKTSEQEQSWREQWQQFASSAKAGMTAMGPKGGTYKPMSFSPKDSEFTLGGKLRREVCAAVYHIPQPLVGILEHATFSNIREQDKHLYRHCLGSWFEMTDQEWERQLLVECADQRAVYLEFNLDAQLAGTPEERATSIKESTGRPWRTVNEARALENLPRIDQPDLDTVAPQQGGPSDASARPAPTSEAVPPSPTAASDGAPDTTARLVAPVIHAVQMRQWARLRKLPIAERAAAFDLDRWTRELADDLTPIVGADDGARVAAALNGELLARLEGDAVRARLDTLEQRPSQPAKVRRTFERNPATGLVDAFVEETL